MAAEHNKHWKIGNVEIARIVEVYGFEDDLSVLLEGGTPEQLLRHDWLRPHFVTPEGRMIISFQAFAVRAGERRMMIDTCIGADRTRQFDVFTNLQTSFLEDLEIAGFPTESIDTVLCTHLHFDHVGWNTRKVDGRWVPTFPNARYLFGRTEWAHWQQVPQDDDPHHLHLSDAIQPVLDAGLVEFVESDHRLTEEIWLEPTPGHTPGHVSVHIRSEGEEAVITGDVVHHPYQFAEPDIKGNFDLDAARASATRRAFLERYQDRKALIIGSHFPEPTSGWIERDTRNWRLSVD
jgi:glyoxylase-like metal-dependent hydrolase (beta-lactamase superfamily II)